MKDRNQKRKDGQTPGKEKGPYSAAQDKATRKDAAASHKDNYDEPSRESQTKSRSGNRVGGSNH